MNAELLNGGELAFVGDAVMTLQVREYLLKKGISHLKALQENQIRYVSASYQATFAREIERELEEEDAAVFKRGRNYKSHSTAKNASVIDYRYATALEALWGYWYLSGQEEKLEKMFYRFIGETDEQYY